MQPASVLLANPIGVEPNSTPATMLLVRVDDGALDVGLRTRIIRLINAVIQDCDGSFAFDSRTTAVPLGEHEAASAGFLAERIRLMVAAMRAALPAPTVTVAIATADQLGPADLDAMRHGRNRVIRFSCAGRAHS